MDFQSTRPLAAIGTFIDWGRIGLRELGQRLAEALAGRKAQPAPVRVRVNER
jgi:hypothetical protein